MDKDIFVSYSRRNQAVCRQLVAALARTESDTWVDWDGIPLSSDWWGEIQRGIEGAETFLILLSNDWLASPVCHLEAAYARRFNKRIVPVVYGQIDSDAALKELTDRGLDVAVVDLLDGQALDNLARDNWRALSKINWAFYREDDFTEGASKLLAALQTDLNHARAHTRLLNRALEWQRGGQDTSLLLRGIDLDQAVGWLAYEKGKEPLPTDLHVHYIDASVAQRKAEEDAVRDQQARELSLKARALNRARLLIASLGVFLVVAALLTAFALQQRTEAIEQAERADREAQIAKAREVAAQALGLMGNRPAQAALLGIAAYQTAPVFETESALLTLIGAVQGRLSTFYNSGTAILDLTYSPSDRWLAVSHDFGAERLTLLDALTGEVVSERVMDENASLAAYFINDETLLFSHDAGVSSISIDANGQWVDERELFTYSEDILYAEFSPDGKLVATAAFTTSELIVRVYDVDSGEMLTQTETALEDANSVFIDMAFDPTSSSIIVNQTLSSPVLIDIEAGSATSIETANIATQGILQAYFHASGQYLVLAALPGGDNSFIALYDPATDSLAASTVVSINVQWITPNPNGSEVLVFENGGGFKTYLIQNGQVLFDRVYHENDIVSVAFRNTDYSHFATGDLGGVTALWDDRATPPLQSIIEDDISPVIAASVVNGRMAAVVENDSIRQWDIETWQPVGPTIDLQNEDLYILQLFLSPDHARLYALQENSGRVSVWNAVTGEVIDPSFTGDKTLSFIELSPDGRLLIGHGEEGLGLWDAATGSSLLETPLRFMDDSDIDITSDINYAAFSPDSTRLAIVAYDGSLWVFSVEGNTLVQQRYQRFNTNLQPLVKFSPDGQTLALVTNSNAVLLIDAMTGQQIIPPLNGSSSPIYDMSFRPDGRVLALINLDNQLWLWDTARGLPIGTPTQAHYLAYDLAFSASGQSLITVGTGPVISEWDFSPQRSVEVLCESVGRDLTPDEWALYIGQTETYHPVCGGD